MDASLVATQFLLPNARRSFRGHNRRANRWFAPTPLNVFHPFCCKGVCPAFRGRFITQAFFLRSNVIVFFHVLYRPREHCAVVKTGGALTPFSQHPPFNLMNFCYSFGVFVFLLRARWIAGMVVVFVVGRLYSKLLRWTTCRSPWSTSAATRGLKAPSRLPPSTTRRTAWR